MGGWFWKFIIFVLLLILAGCTTDKIYSQVAENLTLSKSDLPAGWSQYFSEPKDFTEWPADNRLRAQQRGYIDGYQTTFVNNSEGMLTIANSIYVNANMQELYEEALKNYDAGTRLNNGRTELLHRMADPKIGQYSFEYNITILDDRMNFSYYEFFFIEKNVITNVRCIVQEHSIDNPHEFCKSLLPIIDVKIKNAGRLAVPPMKDTLLTAPVENFMPEKKDFSSEWALLQDQQVKRAELPSNFRIAAGPGQFMEGRFRVFSNDSAHKVIVVSSLYGQVVDEHTFASKNDSYAEEFTRFTTIDSALAMQRITGKDIGERTWWVNITRPDGSRYVNVYFGSKNIMHEVICDMPLYDESLEWCGRIAELAANRIPEKSSAYSVLPETRDVSISSTSSMLVYNTTELAEKAKQFLDEQYNLPNGSVGIAKITDYNATLLAIEHPRFKLNYLIIKVNRFKEEYGNRTLEDVEREECQDMSNNSMTTYEQCMQRAPDVFGSSLYFPTYLCPLNMTPEEMTGSVGPGGRCTGVEGAIDSSNDDLLREMGFGYRYRYLRNVLNMSPYGADADSKVQQFMLDLVAAEWNETPQPVVEVQFNIEIKGVGCYPYSIRVYFDRTLSPLTANEDVICVD